MKSPFKMSIIDNFGGKKVKNQSLVHCAAKSGDSVLLKHLLDKGVSVHSQCAIGYTALHYAVMTQDTKIIELLLKKGASIHTGDNEGKTPLDLALEIYSSNGVQLSPKCKILMLLLSYTLLDDDTRSLFAYLAVEKNDEDLLTFFLNKYSVLKVHSTYEDCRSLLHVAAELNYPKIVKILIEHGVDLHAKTINGESPLHLAAAAGNLEIVSQLLHSGVEVDSPDNNGSVPLHYAIRNNRRNIILLLTNLPKTRAKKLNQDISSIPSLLHYAVIKNDEEFFNLALKNRNVDLNSRTKDGETPLHFAIVYNRLKLIYELVKRGAEINAKSSNGETPLHLAAALGQLHSVEYLLRKAAKVNCVNTSGSTPLHYVLDRERCNDVVGGYNRPLSLLDDMKPRFAIIKTLLANKASPNIRDHSGKTPLHFAMTMNVVSKNNIKYRIDTIRCLVNHGAELNTVCNNGHTPMFYGFDTMDEKMLWWLIRRGANVQDDPRSTDSFLSKAIKFKNVKMIDVLLEAGVQVNSRNLFEASFVNEIDKNNYFEILEMLTNQISDVKAVITKIGQFLDSEWHLSQKDKEDIMNRLTAITVRREIIGEIIIKADDFNVDDFPVEDIRNRFSKCMDQVFKMKQVQIDDEGLSLYAVFMASMDKLSNYVLNPKLKTYLYSDQFVETFPNCFNLLQSRFKKARIRKLLLDFSSESLLNLVNKAHNIKLPLSVRNQIVQYLSMIDLTHLMQFRFVQGSLVCSTSKPINKF